MAYYFAYNPGAEETLQALRTQLDAVTDTQLKPLLKSVKLLLNKAKRNSSLDVSDADAIHGALKGALEGCGDKDRSHIEDALEILGPVREIATNETRHPLHIDKALEAKLKLVHDAMEAIQKRVPDTIDPGMHMDRRLPAQHAKVRSSTEAALKALDNADNDHLITVEESASLLTLVRNVKSVCSVHMALRDQTLAEEAEKAMSEIHKKAAKANRPH